MGTAFFKPKPGGGINHGSGVPELIPQPGRWGSSALCEALAVGALIDGRIILVGAYRDTVKRAVVSAGGMVFALLDSAADGHICVSTRHNEIPPCLVYSQYAPPQS